jgi:hypothetical protein
VGRRARRTPLEAGVQRAEARKRGMKPDGSGPILCLAVHLFEYCIAYHESGMRA